MPLRRRRVSGTLAYNFARYLAYAWRKESSLFLRVARNPPGAAIVHLLHRDISKYLAVQSIVTDLFRSFSVD